jgi:hypothetical protein
MIPQWAVRLPKDQTGALGRLRTTPGIELHEAKNEVWLRGLTRTESLDRELMLLPGASRFTVLPDGQLLAWGQRVPLGYLPEGTWHPLSNWLVFEIPPAAFAARSFHRVTLRIEPSHEETPATVLVTTLNAWRQYCVTAAEVRLRPLMFAVAEDGRVMVRGAPLPSAPGERYVETRGIAVPCGFSIVPRLDAELIAQLLELSAGDLALFDRGGGYERISAGEFVRASRSAARLSAQEFAHG